MMFVILQRSLNNFGDNVGDVAEWVRIFSVYVAKQFILATMVWDRNKVDDNFGSFSPILLPMAMAGLGIVFSILGMIVRIKDEKSSVQGALNMGKLFFHHHDSIASYFLVLYDACNFNIAQCDIYINDIFILSF